jgi:prepilin-type N-terminal cleavage/methylation domain-containing protein
MRSKLKKTNSKGFTIIEVMIVLVIAGLILLIVFLAVPALQRNARNTSRKNDVSSILAAVTEFIDNNNGTVPTAGTWANPSYTFNTPAGATSQAKLGYYTAGAGTGKGQIDFVAAGTATAAGTLNSAAADYAIIATGTQCIAGNAGGSQGGSQKGVSIVYEIETGANTFAQQCESE